LRFAEGEGPQLPPIRDAAGVDALDLSKVASAIEPILETVRKVAADVGAATLIGFAGSPFTVACYMVEGHGSKEFGAVRAIAHGDPALFARLIGVIEAATITYLSAQIAAGAETVMLFDSWAGMLPPRLFREYVIAPTTRIVAALKLLHPRIPVIGFPRLAGVMVGEYARETGVQAVHLDTTMDPACVELPDGIAAQGNLDPVALLVGGAALVTETSGILVARRGLPNIFNLGHGIIKETPPEHVAALVAQVRAA
jgi:uroporphyrinogen decarboxylase